MRQDDKHARGSPWPRVWRASLLTAKPGAAILVPTASAQISNNFFNQLFFQNLKEIVMENLCNGVKLS